MIQNAKYPTSFSYMTLTPSFESAFSRPSLNDCKLNCNMKNHKVNIVQSLDCFVKVGSQPNTSESWKVPRVWVKKSERDHSVHPAHKKIINDININSMVTGTREIKKQVLLVGRPLLGTFWRENCAPNSFLNLQPQIPLLSKANQNRPQKVFATKNESYLSREFTSSNRSITSISRILVSSSSTK